MKKRFGTFICLYFVLAVLLAPRAFAAEIIDSGYCGSEGDGTNLTWTLDDEGTLTISGEGEMADYASYETPWWYEYSEIIAKAVIEKGVSNVGNSTFSGCEQLVVVGIADSVTAIGDNAFLGCQSLISIDIPKGVMSIGNNAFHGCSTLTSVTIPGDVEMIGEQAFIGCTALTAFEVDLSNTCYAAVDGFLYSNDKRTLVCVPAGCRAIDITLPNTVETIHKYAFYGASVSTVVMPDSITTVGTGAFFACESLTDVTMPNGVSSIEDETFFGCCSLTSIVMPDGIMTIGADAFAYCRALTEVKLPNTVVSVGDGAFGDCSALKMVDIPQGLLSIGESAFQYCALSSVEIPNSVMTIGEGAFSGCSSLAEITVDADNPNYAARNGMLFDKAFSKLLCYPNGIPGSSFVIPNDVQVIGNRAFRYNESLHSIVIPGTVTHIEKSAFCYCRALTSVQVEDGIQCISDDAFRGCSKLVRIQMPASVTEMGKRVFRGCSSLTAVALPNGVKTIQSFDFWGCTSLTTVVIPESVASIEHMAFDQCPNIATIIFCGDAPEPHVTIFPDSTATAYYPQEKESWDAVGDLRPEFGIDLVWVPYTKDMIYHTRFSVDTIPQDEFNLKITVTRFGKSADDVAMIALYSAEGQFLEMTVWELSDETAQTYTLSRDNTDGKIGQIKVFILDSLSNPIPLAEAAEITSGT